MYNPKRKKERFTDSGRKKGFQVVYGIKTDELSLNNNFLLLSTLAFGTVMNIVSIKTSVTDLFYPLSSSGNKLSHIITFKLKSCKPITHPALTPEGF